MTAPRHSELQSSPRRKWQRPTVTPVGTLSDVLRGGPGKLTTVVGDPGEPRKVPGGDK